MGVFYNMKELDIRSGTEEDKNYLIKWLEEPGILKWFPMCNLAEIEDAVRVWVSYAKYGALLTATLDQKPCGVANLYLQPFRKLAHHALFAIIVGEEYRGKGIGTALMHELFILAKKFKLEILHLEVYEGNPARHLYERLGFKTYGFQSRFIKENNKFYGKYFMQKKL